MAEILCRNEFIKYFPQKVTRLLRSDVGPFSKAAEIERRQAFCDEILGQLPFDLIGMDETPPYAKISIQRGERTNSHYTLERHNINNLLRDLKEAPNDNKAVPMTIQEFFAALSSQQAASGIPVAKRAPKEKVSGGALTANEEIGASEPEAAHLKEQLQAVASDNESVALLERELNLARAHLASETKARRASEYLLNGVWAIVKKYKHGRPARTTTAPGDTVGTDAALQRAGHNPQHASALYAAPSQASRQARRINSAERLVVHGVPPKNPQGAVPDTSADPTTPRATTTREVDEAPGPQPPPTELDLTDPKRAIEAVARIMSILERRRSKRGVKYHMPQVETSFQEGASWGWSGGGGGGRGGCGGGRRGIAGSGVSEE
ncbi:hypothetical protein EI94DRAFT_1801366 [Lactarius quietus]|nr:hypothetical protein EI94DRAFT_1801366 [Lactarius quietus]